MKVGSGILEHHCHHLKVVLQHMNYEELLSCGPCHWHRFQFFICSFHAHVKFEFDKRRFGEAKKNEIHCCMTVERQIKLN